MFKKLKNAISSMYVDFIISRGGLVNTNGRDLDYEYMLKMLYLAGTTDNLPILVGTQMEMDRLTEFSEIADSYGFMVLGFNANYTKKTIETLKLADVKDVIVSETVPKSLHDLLYENNIKITCGFYREEQE